MLHRLLRVQPAAAANLERVTLARWKLRQPLRQPHQACGGTSASASRCPTTTPTRATGRLSIGCLRSSCAASSTRRPAGASRAAACPPTARSSLGAGLGAPALEPRFAHRPRPQALRPLAAEADEGPAHRRTRSARLSVRAREVRPTHRTRSRPGERPPAATTCLERRQRLPHHLTAQLPPRMLSWQALRAAWRRRRPTDTNHRPWSITAAQTAVATAAGDRHRGTCPLP